MRVATIDQAGSPTERIHPSTGMRNLLRNFLGDWQTTGTQDEQAFLNEFANPHGTIHPHFHDCDQFQVIVAGDCSIAKHRTVPFGIHFTDAYTTYGPIHAGPRGFSFFTLRTVHGCRSQYMPESRGQLAGRKRGREVSCHAAVEAAGRPAPVFFQNLIEPHPDGLEIGLMTLAPLATGRVSPAYRGRGQYFLVAAGTLLREGIELAPLSLLFAAPDEDVPALVAGEAGTRLLFMQFPRTESHDGMTARGAR